jgi:hypothetical protein
MCRRVQCEQCHKPTFAGCGKHVEQVLRGIPDEGRCHCNEAQALAKAPAAPSQFVSPAA